MTRHATSNPSASRECGSSFTIWRSRASTSTSNSMSFDTHICFSHMEKNIECYSTSKLYRHHSSLGIVEEFVDSRQQQNVGQKNTAEDSLGGQTENLIGKLAPYVILGRVNLLE